MHRYRELRCRAVLFDCDGVLVDSRADGERAWRIWAREYGLDERAVLAGIHGRRSRDTVRAHLPASDVSRGVERIDAIEVGLAAHTEAIAGAAHLMRLVLAHSAVVTSASPGLLDARLTAAGVPRPDVVVTGCDVTAGKPGPQPYLLAARRLGIPVAACVVVEDSAPGIASARAAGAAAVLGVGADAARCRPDVAVSDLRGIEWTGAALRCPTSPSAGSHHYDDKGFRPSC